MGHTFSSSIETKNDNNDNNYDISSVEVKTHATMETATV